MQPFELMHEDENMPELTGLAAIDVDPLSVITCITNEQLTVEDQCGYIYEYGVDHFDCDAPEMTPVNRSNMLRPVMVDTEECRSVPRASPPDSRTARGMSLAPHMGVTRRRCKAMCYDVESTFYGDERDCSEKPILMIGTYCSTCREAHCFLNCGSEHMDTVSSCTVLDHLLGDVHVKLHQLESSRAVVRSTMNYIAEHDVSYFGGFNNIGFDNPVMSQFFLDFDHEGVTYDWIRRGTHAAGVFKVGRLVATGYTTSVDDRDTRSLCRSSGAPCEQQGCIGHLSLLDDSADTCETYLPPVFTFCMDEDESSADPVGQSLAMWIDAVVSSVDTVEQYEESLRRSHQCRRSTRRRDETFYQGHRARWSILPWVDDLLRAKSGLIRSHCTKKQVTGTTKGMMVNDVSLDEDVVLVPQDSCIQGGVACLSRPPMLNWTSMQLVRLGTSKDDCMVAHPSLWAALHGDCDGDVGTVTRLSSVAATSMARMPRAPPVKVDEMKWNLDGSFHAFNTGMRGCDVVSMTESHSVINDMEPCNSLRLHCVAGCVSSMVVDKCPIAVREIALVERFYLGRAWHRLRHLVIWRWIRRLDEGYG